MNGLHWLQCFRWCLCSTLFGHSIAVLVISCNDLTNFTNLGCGVPSRVEFTVACVRLSILLPIYRFLELLTKRVFFKAAISICVYGVILIHNRLFFTDRFSFIRTIHHQRIALCSVILPLWIAAAATSLNRCDELCTSYCPITASPLRYGGQACYCDGSEGGLSQKAGYNEMSWSIAIS